LQRPVELAQFTSWVFGERIRTAGLPPSFGTVGDGLDKRLSSHCTSSPIEFV